MRWLGPSFEVGGELCYSLLTAKAQVIQRSSVAPLTREERSTEDIKNMKKEFTRELSTRLENKQNNTDLIETPDTINDDKYSIITETDVSSIGFA